jgi:hypothetical protein
LHVSVTLNETRDFSRHGLGQRRELAAVRRLGPWITTFVWIANAVWIRGCTGPSAAAVGGGGGHSWLSGIVREGGVAGSDGERCHEHKGESGAQAAYRPGSCPRAAMPCCKDPVPDHSITSDRWMGVGVGRRLWRGSPKRVVTIPRIRTQLWRVVVVKPARGRCSFPAWRGQTPAVDRDLVQCGVNITASVKVSFRLSLYSFELL